MNRRWVGLVGAAAVVASTLSVGALTPAVAAPCDPGGNPIVCENSKPGNPASEWDNFYGAGDDTIQGFSTDISVNVGAPVRFKIDTPASAYSIDIYRLGYYGGNGARKVATISPSASLPQNQPNCLKDPATKLVDCGNWGISASWNVPSTAVSGVYIAVPTRTDTGGKSHIAFVVRNDSSHSDVVFQTSDTTWQAYNDWGGSNFYWGEGGRATKLSYNRPFGTRQGTTSRDWLFANEYPMIRFLERNGYDLSYISGLDTDRAGSLLLNHKTYLSVGHDEYWSGTQRANIESARNAGVNLAFFSGNEMYWKTRWEPSIDGSGTANRTLVCYKETWDNDKTDPSAEWTGTWRDPRFSPPSNGGRPENAVTGTAYMSNSTDLAVTVTAAEGKTRMWRNTAAAGLGSGQSLALAPHTVGYESNEDLDNGFRPPGLVRLSTTTGPSPEYLRDFGNTVTPGTTTHHTTMYRAPSGALVYSAGTIQWSWGLDDNHDGPFTAPADPAMQQATINLLADMSAQPGSLMAGRSAAAKSTDTTAPTTTITSPAAGSMAPNSTLVTVTGTATDTGGVVAGVEVSTDGGLRWHPATGTASWSYSYYQTGTEAVSIKARATDDSANIGSAVTVATATRCPCTIFAGQAPITPDAGDGGELEAGIRFTPQVDGFVTGVRFYKSAANTGQHTGSLWTTTGTRLATGTFTNETATGWQTLQFAAPVAVTAGTDYISSYYAPNGRYAADSNAFYIADIVSPPLVASRTTDAEPTGVFNLGAGFPARTFRGTNYGVDVVFDDRDTYPAAVLASQPIANASSVGTDVNPSATFSEAVVPGSVVFGLTAAGGGGVAGSTAYNAATRTAVFTPSAALQRGVVYTASVSATDLASNAMPSPATWTFRTAYPSPDPGTCPCSLWDDAATPAIPSVNDANAVEVGVRFSADSDGQVLGMRFYKGPQNIGSHVGTLWSSTGQALATVTFSNETSTGWQTANFATPVTVTPGQEYVLSYKATAGYYSATSSMFRGAGFSNPPLSVPVDGAVYRYGGGFPTSGSDTNYWVDPIFNVSSTVRPEVISSSPADNSTNVPVSSAVAATFSMPVQIGSPQVTVSGPSGQVAGAVTLNATRRTVTFTPSAALQAGTVYQVTVSGARNAGGAPMVASHTFDFTTAGPGVCPCTLFSSSATPSTVDSQDANAITVGVRFVADRDGFIQGVRFHKAAANTGVHTGSLWSAAGIRLATVTFGGESASGWQSATFSQAVSVTAGTTYVVSYHAPNGHYSVTRDFFATDYTNGPLTAAASPGNGVFGYGPDAFPTSSYSGSNYWVDPVFMTGAAPDSSAPTLTSTSPLAGASSVATSVAPSAVLSEPVSAPSVVVTMATTGGVAVAGAGAYNATTRTVTFTPTSALARGVSYRVSVSATDVAGNATTSPETWTFRTMLPSPTPGVCPCSLWDDTVVPDTITAADGANVELGTAFSASRDGELAGVRFYKGPANTGAHTVSLWSVTGTQLATAPVTGETTTGWQTASFASPVAVTAGTTYVVSYRAPNGRYSATGGAFAAPVTVGPLTAPANAGRYLYGGGYPSNTSGASYAVDPVFDESGSTPLTDTTGPVITSVQGTAGAGGTTATVTWTTDESSSSVVQYGPTTSLGSSSNGSDGTSHSVALSGLTSSTTYYFRVTSVDAGGNSTTSPVVSGAPATFATPDVTAPTVSAVASSGSGTTATVTWTTNESATTSVDYGTTTALGTTATGPAGTSHSVNLTGLAPNTRYYYRVTSADPAGNSATSPASPAAPTSYLPTVVPITHTTVADFAPGTGAYESDTAGGEVMATATLGTEFSGTTIPTGWASGALVTGGTTTYAGGSATLSGTRLYTGTGASGRNVTAAATLGAGQSLGWASIAAGSTTVTASFVMTAAGALTARIDDDGTINQTIAIPGTWTGAEHEYRVDWVSNTAVFFIDGLQVATSAFSPQVSLRVVASDPTTAAPTLLLDWVRVGPYASATTWTSAVVDAGATVGWDTLTRDVVLPAGTTLTIQVRSGSTLSPLTGWTAWTTVSATTNSITRSSRYLQYRLQFTSSGTRFVSAAVRGVTLNYHVL